MNTTPLKILLLLALAGCAHTPDPQPSLDAMTKRVRQGVPTAEPGRDFALETPNLQGQSLTQDQAVAYAITRHPAIAADLARIRESQAQFIQAGVLPNPVLYGTLGLTSDGGIGFAMASLTQSLSALWQRADRQAIADSQLQQTILRVASSTLETTAAAQRAHRQLLYRQETLALLNEKSKLFEQMSRAAKDRFDTGSGDTADLTAIDALAQRNALEQQQAQAALADARLALLHAMGMASASVDFAALPAASTPPQFNDEAQALALGLAQRLDVQAAHFSVLTAEKQLALAKNKRIPETTLGVEYQKDDS